MLTVLAVVSLMHDVSPRAGYSLSLSFVDITLHSGNVTSKQLPPGPVIYYHESVAPRHLFGKIDAPPQEISNLTFTLDRSFVGYDRHLCEGRATSRVGQNSKV